MNDAQIWAAALATCWVAVLVIFGGFAAWAWWDIERHELEAEQWWTERELRATWEEGA
mgnify:CR=1 FL=1